MFFVSTRGEGEAVSSAQAVIRGLAGDKGLYVPENIPELKYDIESMLSSDYRDVAYKVIGQFFTDFSEEELLHCVNGAYDDKFDAEDIAPLVHVGAVSFLELYHGRTAAFKDMALSILPYFMTTSMRKEREDKKVVILTATSGDTGKAALEGFADVLGTQIIVFYPKDGVSAIQERQMVTQKGANVKVYAIRGNFDDAQAGVKDIFADEKLAKVLADDGVRLSSANSINIGRLVPQVAYYVYAYTQMVTSGKIELGDKINVVVPTGNFGNILAAWYAKQMGTPIDKFICASNENNVLTDFINTGVYDANREFILTCSPSMDILISSNLERLLWHLSGGNSSEIRAYMSSLANTGRYEVSEKIREGMSDFASGYATMRQTHDVISKMWIDEGYLIDTHTAVAKAVYDDYVLRTSDRTPAIIVSTASAYKFADKVADCLGLPKAADEFAYIDLLHEATGANIPEGLRGLAGKVVTQDNLIDVSEMKEGVLTSV
jgi:threonine synthase